MKFSIFFVFSLTLFGQTFTTTALSSGVVTPADTWIMQEGSGNTFADSSATANTATAGGTITWETGPGALTTGAHFPGTFSTVAANYTNFNPNATTAFSISMWISFDFTGSFGSTSQTLISQTGSSGQGWWIVTEPGVPPTKQITFFFQDTSGKYFGMGFGAGLAANILYHLVFTYDGSGLNTGMMMWANGSLAPYNGWSNTSISRTPSATTPNAPVYLGSCSCALGPHQGFQGGTRLYNRVLTSTEILTLYEAGPMVDTYLAASAVPNPVNASSFASLDLTCGSNGVKIGGGTPTDNTAKLNAVLLTASSTNPVDLVFSGCSATTGLFIPQAGYVTIEGNGTSTSGLYVITGSNQYVISNSYGSVPQATSLPSQGSSVTIKNLQLDGNRRGPNAIGSDLRGSSAPGWIIDLNLANISGVTISNVLLYDSPLYGFLGENLSNATISNISIYSPTLAFETDGVHLDGPGSNISIGPGTCYTGDDCVALNASEGYAGTLSNITITGMAQSGDSVNGLRAQYTLTSATLNGCSLPNVTSVLNEYTLSPAVFNSYCMSALISGSAVFSGSFATQ